jgi:hypothetical protein
VADATSPSARLDLSRALQGADALIIAIATPAKLNVLGKRQSTSGYSTRT